MQRYDYIDFKQYLLNTNIITAAELNITRSFNTSIAKVSAGVYLYAVRIYVAGTHDGPGFRPGPPKECKDELSGINFWWGRWNDPRTMTVFFIGNHITNDLKRIKIFGRDKIDESYHKADYRLMNYDDKIYLYSNTLHDMTELHVSDVVRSGSYFYADNIDKHGHNFSPFAILGSRGKSKIEFFDWFYPFGIRILEGYTTGDNKSKKAQLLLYNSNCPLLGSGSTADTPPNVFGRNTGVMPMFSFGTPTISIGDEIYLGVGHIKLHSDKRYVEGSRIQKFIDRLHTDMKTAYGSQYVRHRGLPDGDCAGYVYMMFFYVFNRREWTFDLSDFYLPLHLGLDDYHFSLVFPMGLVVDGSTVIVTAGEGDYYSIALTYDLQYVIGLCKHSSVYFDLQDEAKYYISAYDGQQNYLGETLEAIKYAAKSP